jgi:hypothetical protein
MTKLNLLKKTKIFKFIAVFMSFTFLSSGIVTAGSINTPTSYLPEKVSPSLDAEKIKDLFIPESFGSIVKKWEPEPIENNKSVILIQDAHCNYEAQHNIAKILETLVRDYKIDLVAIEGAAGDIDLSRFGKLADTKAKEKVTDIFVKRGIVTGPEYLRITKYNEAPFGLYGIEDGELYVKNFISFRNSISNSKDTQYFIDELSTVVNNLKDKIYSKELFEFDNKICSYNSNEVSLTDYVKELNKRKSICNKKYTDFCRVNRSITLEERIDFKKVEKEREQLIRNIEKGLPKEELEEFVKKSLLFKLGKVSSVEYYSYLEKYFNQSKQINLRRYIHLTKIQAKIDSDRLFRDIQNIENEIKECLFNNNIERSLDNVSKRISILDKLFKLQLTRGDLEYFKNHKYEFSTSSLLSFIKIQAPLNNIQLSPAFNDNEFLKKIDQYITPSDKFYQEALLRDDVLVNNTLEKMEKENKDIAVMITGGFHTEGITKLVQAKGMGYTVISPKITKVQENCPYMSLMMDKNINPIEKDGTYFIHSYTVKNNMLSTPEFISPTNKLRNELRGLGELGEKLAEQIDALLRQKEEGKVSDQDIERILTEMSKLYKHSELVLRILKDLRRVILQKEGGLDTGAVEKAGGGRMKRIGIGNEREYSDEDRERFKKSKVIIAKKGFLKEVLYIKGILSKDAIKNKIKRLEKAYGRHLNIIVVEADLGDDEACHFIEGNTLYIVLNEVGYGAKDEIIRIEAVFHELCEAFWRKELPADDVDRRRKAHVYASAEEVSQFSNDRKQITPAHKAMLDSMTIEELMALFSEDRDEHVRWWYRFKYNEEMKPGYNPKVYEDNTKYMFTFQDYIEKRVSEMVKANAGNLEFLGNFFLSLIRVEFSETGWKWANGGNIQPLKMAVKMGYFKKILLEIMSLIAEHHILPSENKIGVFLQNISHLMTEDDYSFLTDNVLANLKNTTIDDSQRKELCCLLDEAYVHANDDNRRTISQHVLKTIEKEGINSQLIDNLFNILTRSMDQGSEAVTRQILKKGLTEINNEFSRVADNTIGLSYEKTKEVMKTCKSILGIFMSKIDTYIRSNNLEGLKDIVNYLNSLAEDKNINMNIKSEIMRTLVRILRTEDIPNKKRILPPKTLYENMSESEQESRGLGIPLIFWDAIGGTYKPETPCEKIFKALKHIKDRNYDVRIGYRILLGCKDRKDILDEVVNNAEQYSPEIVLYAFSLYPELHSDRIYIEKLVDIAQSWLVVMSESRADNDWVFRIFNDTYLQDETLKVLCTAVNIVMWNRYSDLVNESEFKRIMEKISHAKVVPYDRKTNSTLVFGDRHIVGDAKREKDFILTIAHELMHNYTDGVGLRADNLRDSIIHEFMSEVAAFDLIGVLGFEEADYEFRRRKYGYEQYLDCIIGNEGFSKQCHEGGLALLEIMFLFSQQIGKPIDWCKLSMAALVVVKNRKTEEIKQGLLSLELFIGLIMKEYSGKVGGTLNFEKIEEILKTISYPLLEGLQQTQQMTIHPQTLTGEQDMDEHKRLIMYDDYLGIMAKSPKAEVSVLSQQSLIAIFNALMDRFRKGLRENLESLGLSKAVIDQILKHGLLSIDKNGQIFANMDILRLIARIERTNVGAILRRSLYHEKVHDLLKRKLGDEGKKRLLEDLKLKLGENLQKVINVMEEEFGKFRKGEELNLDELLEELIVKYYTYRFCNSDSDLFTGGALGNVGSVIIDVITGIDGELNNLFVIDGDISEDTQKKRLSEVSKKSKELGGISIIKYRDVRREVKKEINAVISRLNPDFDKMVRDEYEKVLGELAEKLGISADDLRHVLSREYLELINALMSYLKNEDGDVKKAIKLIAENAEKIEEVFKMASIVDSEDTKIIKEKIVLFLGLRALEKAGQLERPKCVSALQKALEDKAGNVGIDKDFIEGVIDHLYDEVDTFTEEGRELHPTRYFMSFIELIKETFEVTHDDHINNLIQELIAYKYVQAVTKRAFATKGDEKPIPSSNIEEIINRYVHNRDERYKINVANVLALYLINPDSVTISGESISSINKLKNRKGFSDRDWGKETIDAINRNIVDENKVNKEARGEKVKLLAGAKASKMEKDAVVTAYNNYGQKIAKELGLEEEFDLEVSNTTFSYDVTSIFGNLEARKDAQYNLYDINTLSLTMMSLIAKVQKAKSYGNRNLFVTEVELSDSQKEALIKFLEDQGITDVTKDQFVSAEEYETKAHEGGNRVVAMTGDLLNNRLRDKKAHKEGDRVLLANQSESDFMLLADMAIVAASTKELEGENGMKARFKQLFRAYYKGSIGEDEITEWISKIDVVSGIIQILLPPISPFVKAYYDALKGARELVQQAA